MKLAHCKTRHEPIVWTVTTHGKHMPVDADPVLARRGFRLEEVDGETITAVFTTAPEPNERLYLSHFSTCPQAAAHRRSA